MNLSYLLALRYIKGLGIKSSLSTVALISFISIALSTASLALVTSVMNGFESVTKQKIQNINPQLISVNKIDNLDKLLSIEGIEAVAPVATENVLLGSINQNAPSFFDYAILKGIDPKLEQKTTALFSKFRNLIGSLDLLNDDYILIGKELSKEKDIFPGDKISLYIPLQGNKNKNIKFKKLDVTILGLIDTGINEYDNSLIVSSISTLQKLSSTYKEQVGLKIKPEYDATTIKNNLAFLGYLFLSWQDLYPALFSALKLEKYASFIVLTLILLVAIINLIALLFMIITQKKRDIAILKAVGCPLELIKKIFITLSLILVSSATISGLTLAFLAGIFIQNYPFIELPDIYYVTTLPIKMTLPIFLAVFVLTLFFGLIATALALRELKTLNSIQTLKFEI